MGCGAYLQSFSKAVLLMMMLSGCSSQISQENAISPSRGLSGQQGIHHEVRLGQTLWSIARAYKTDVSLLQQANQLNDSDVLYVGRKLYIPGATEVQDVASRCPCSSVAVQQVQTEQFTPAPAPSSSSGERSLPLVSRDGESAASVRFVWPLFGDVRRGIEQDETRRHHGINIYAPQGTPVQAAADGQVIFSGWGPEGYGRMVILRHQAGLVTIYAHNDNNVVNNGDQVRQGDQVAVVGRSGRVQENSLHFEVRQNTVPVPPEKFLPPRSQSTVSLR